PRSDYQMASFNSVTIPAGSSSATVTIRPIDDSIVEGPETVVLTIDSDTHYIVGSPGSATVTIADNDQPPPLVADFTVSPLLGIIPLTANFCASPTSGNAPLNVRFTDKSTDTITAWDWNVGDGTSRKSLRIHASLPLPPLPLGEQ